MRGVVAVDGDDEGNRETRRSVVACLAPDRHSCSHVLPVPLAVVAPLLSIFRRQLANLLRSSKFQHDI